MHFHFLINFLFTSQSPHRELISTTFILDICRLFCAPGFISLSLSELLCHSKVPLHTHSPSSSSCTPRIPLLSMHIELHLLSFAPCFHTFTKLSHDIQMNSPLPLSVHSSLFYVASDSKLCSSVKSVTSLFFFKYHHYLSLYLSISCFCICLNHL